MKNLRIVFCSAFFYAHAPGYYLTFISFALFRFEQQTIREKIDLYLLFYFDRFLPLFAFAS
jgi:hypothetical protein